MGILTAARERTVVFDGAMGTQLMARGFASQTCPEEWNVSHPEVVADVHRAYYAAGADVVLTNTLGGTRAKLAHYGFEARVAELNASAATVAATVRDDHAAGRFVGGDIGPTGRFLKPMGDLEPNELRDMFAEQAAALLEGGADCLVIETMFDLAETVLAIEGCRHVTGKPVVASMTFGLTPRGYRTMMGVDPRQAAHALVEAGATDVPVLAEPNAGQPRLEGEQTVYDETPKHFASTMKQIVRQGAAMVGGCCGTTPEFIAALVKAVGR